MPYKDPEKAKAQKIKWRLANKEKAAVSRRKTYLKYKDKVLEQSKNYYANNKEKYRQRNKRRYKENKEKSLEYSKKWYRENKERKYQKQKELIASNKKEFDAKRRAYENRRLRNDPCWKLKKNTRIRMISYLKQKYAYKKNKRASEILGCDYKFYKEFLENQFNEQMTWENYGSYWEIDHIIPLVNFNLLNEKELLFAFNYKNTRPLSKEMNKKRVKKIEGFIFKENATVESYGIN